MNTSRSGTDMTGRQSRGVLAALGAVSLLLLAGGWFLPLWTATLHAPQYPGGLTMRAYGHDVTGDVDEISGLNHYVGMRAFDLADFPEIALWPFALGVAIVAVLLALLMGRPWLRRLGLLYLWATPVGVLAVVQLRLHQYGQDLDPGAALRIEPFTPLVVGPTEVWNFTTWSWPGLGVLSLLLAATLLTFGPGLAGRLGVRVGVGTGAVVLLALSLALLPAGPPAAAADDGHGIDLTARLADAVPGQRIVVPPGVHAGGLVIEVPVILEGRPGAVLQGDGTGSVVTVLAAGTVIRGLTVRGSGRGPTGNPAAIRIEADRVTVQGVTVEDSYMGIAVEDAEDVRLVDNVIRGRAGAAIVDESHAVEHEADARDPSSTLAAPTTSARGDAIWLHGADNVLVRGNRITDSRDGIYLSFGSGALLDGNQVDGSRYAVHSMFASDLTLVENHLHDNLAGAVLMYRGPVLLLRNHIERSTSPSTGFAILLKDVIEVEAVQNIVVDNRVGIHLDGPAGAVEPGRFVANTVARNAIGVSAYSSARASFRANSFVENRVQVLPQGGQLRGLVFSDQGWGNLWSSYAGYEGRARGRGAVPHAEGGAVDRLLGRHPELLAIADSPALTLLRSIEERWGRQDPVLIDELPITAALSPAVPAVEPEPIARAIGLLGAALLLLPFLGVLAWPHARRSARRRWTYAVAS